MRKTAAVLALLLGAFGLASPPGALAVQDLLVSNWFGDVLRFNGTNGTARGTFAAEVALARGMALGPDGNRYVSDEANDRVLKYDGRTGDYMGVFAAFASLNGPHGVVFGPDGYLYVASYWSHQILRYNATTGAFVDVFVNGEPLFAPTALAFGPGDVLYACNWFGDVRRFDIGTGTLLGQFDAPGVTEGAVFGIDGNLYVAGGDEVWRFDPSGNPLAVVISGAPLHGAYGVNFGPDGDFYVSSYWGNQILHYDWETGLPEDPFVTGGAFFAPTSLVFADVDPLNPVPRVTGLTPSSRHRGSAGFRLTVAGARFVRNSRVKWNSTFLTTRYLSAGSLRAFVPARLLRARGAARITVFNPLPGGGTSNGKFFVIQ